MSKKRTMVIGSLVSLIGILAIAYIVISNNKMLDEKVMSEELFRVAITDVLESNVTGKVQNVSKPAFRDNLASFDINFTSVDDSITYSIQLSNLGSIDAIVDKIDVEVDKSSSIKYSISGIKENDKIEHNNSISFSLKIDYIAKLADEKDKENIKVVLTVDCVEDVVKTDGTGNLNQKYQSFVVGDVITFNDANWIVIRSSSMTQDYVTVIKETLLTADELGSFASNCSYVDVTSGLHGCDDEASKKSTIYYYRGVGCQYDSSDITQCVNNFDNSFINKFFKDSYLIKLGESNLKEVDGYKIRLLNDDDIYLGIGLPYDLASNNSLTDFNGLPNWLESNPYWTMLDAKKVIEAGPYGDFTSDSSYSHNHYAIGLADYVSAYLVNDSIGVRPVINLLKSSI